MQRFEGLLRFWLIAISLVLGCLTACSCSSEDSKTETSQPLYSALTQVAATLRSTNLAPKPTEPSYANSQGGENIEPENASLLSPSSVSYHTGASEISFLPVGKEAVLSGVKGLATFDLSQKEISAANAGVPATPITITQPTMLSVAGKSEALAWVAYEKVIYLWNSSQPTDAHVLTEYQVPVTGLAMSPNGEELAVASYDSILKSWQVQDNQVLHEWNTPSWLINLSYSPDKKFIAGIDPENFKIYIYDAGNGQLIRTLEWLETASPVLYGAYFSPDWKKVAWIARGSAQIMDVESGNYGPTLNHEDFISAVAWSPDSRILATSAAATITGDFLPVVTLWDIMSGKTVCALSQSNPIIGLSFTPDGTGLAILDSNGDLRMWSVNR